MSSYNQNLSINKIENGYLISLNKNRYYDESELSAFTSWDDVMKFLAANELQKIDVDKNEGVATNG